MISAKERVDELKRKRQSKIDGRLQLIPFYHHFPKLSEFVPGIFRGAMITCMAGTGIGKSKFTRYATILIPYWLKQKENLKYKIIYFALEESEEEFIDYVILMLLNINYGIEIDYASINSYRKDVVSEDILDKMSACAEEVDKILEDVIIVTNTYNPTGMHMRCMQHAKEWGTLVEGEYSPNDPDLQVVVVADHVSLIAGEKDNENNRYLTQNQAMGKWSTHYCLKYITKKLNWAVWNVQQTTMTSEGHEQKKTNTLEPSEADAGDNKIILRDLVNINITLTLNICAVNNKVVYCSITIIL